MRKTVDESQEFSPEPPRPLMRGLPPADPYPTQVLGHVLAPAADAIRDRVGAPPAICGQSVLGAATLAVQGHADIVLPTGHRRPLTNYFLTIAATGERKTAVDTEALRPIRERENSMREKLEGERQEYENSRLAWDKARDAAIKNARPKGSRAAIKAALDALGPAPDAPLEPLLTCPEPTYEGLCRLFFVGQPSLGIFASEGGQFIGGHGMSDDAKLRTAAGLSAAWDGEPFREFRADGVIVLPGRRLAMHLMAQPDVASTMLNDRMLADQGTLSRILVTSPNSASGTRLWREPSTDSDAAMKRYGARILDILELPLPLTAGSQNTLNPRPLPLSDRARRLWIGFYTHIEQRVAASGGLEPIRGLSNKLPEHAARLAAVLGLVTDVEASEISAEYMSAGIILAQHYAAEALRLFEGSRTDAELLLAQKLLGWLRGPWHENAISLPDIYQNGPNAIRDKATATRIVKILEDHGWLVRIDRGALVAGQYRRDAWQIVEGH